MTEYRKYIFIREIGSKFHDLSTYKKEHILNKFKELQEIVKFDKLDYDYWFKQEDLVEKEISEETLKDIIVEMVLME